MRIGTGEVSAVRLGASTVDAVYLGASLVWSGDNEIAALFNEARIFVDWSDAAANDYRLVPSKDAATPSNNLIGLSTGFIVQETGQVTPTRTNFYADLPDPSGVTNNATRVVTTANNQVLYFVRAGQGPMPPVGTYTLRLRARANAGTGPWNINFGFGGGYASGTVQDLDWSDPSNASATTFTATFSYNGISDIALRCATSGSDILIDRIQLYEGSSVPDWGDEVFGGARYAYAFENSITPTAEGYADQTGVVSGFQLLDPAFPFRHTYPEYTILQVSSVDSVTASTQIICGINAGDGGGTTQNNIQVDSTAPYQGEINAFAGNLSRSAHAFNAASDGVFIFGHGRNATQRIVWVDTIPAFKQQWAFAGANVLRWMLGGWNTANIAGARLNTAPGDYCYTVIWDRLLSQDEFALAAEHLRSSLVANAVPNLLPFTDYHVISGDSNSTRGTGDWTQLVTARDYIAGQRPVFASITSVGGQGIPSIDGEVGNRFDEQDGPALLRGTDNGRYSLYNLCIGTNDWNVLAGYPGTVSEQASAYCIRVQSLIGRALDLHERVHVLWYSLLPQTSTNRPDWEAHRLAVNAEMATWIGSQARVHLCDFGGSATIGSRVVQEDGGGPYYLSDQIHLNSAGDVEAAAISGAAISAWRTSLGIAA